MNKNINNDKNSLSDEEIVAETYASRRPAQDFLRKNVPIKLEQQNNPPLMIVPTRHFS